MSYINLLGGMSSAQGPCHVLSAMPAVLVTIELPDYMEGKLVQLYVHSCMTNRNMLNSDIVLRRAIPGGQ